MITSKIIQTPSSSGKTLRDFRRTLLLAVALVAFVPWLTTAQTVGQQKLTRHVPEMVAHLEPVGALPATTNLQLAIGLPLRNAAALTNLLREIYDPASPNYHHYLTPAQFAAQFGPTEKDYQAVIAFARARGLQVTATHPNRVLLDVSGSVAAVEKALHVTMRVYQHPTESRTFYAPDTEPSLDLTVPILHISGLDNYALPHPHLQATPIDPAQTSAQPNSGAGPSGSYLGGDFRKAYVPGTTLTGTGQTVGLLQFDGYTASDITYYESKAGLGNVTLQNVLIDGATGAPSHTGGEVEVSLDIEMAISMAPGLSKVMLYMAPNGAPWVDLLNRMATDNLAKQLSCSWYAPNGAANPSADLIFQQMAAQGQSFFNASGDYDAYTGLISFPGDTPYLTQVGGTTLTTSGPGGAWVSETVWNRNNGIGSGGGISTQYPIPSWQTNASLTASQGSVTKRNTPDVALTAENVYVRANGTDYNVGGTSCAAPLWAGFAALVNQQAVGSGHATVGFVNPAIYALGIAANYTSVFHDITTGNNESPGSPTKFSAVAGYDLCTGWGTPAGQNLINALANPEPLWITPAVGFAANGGAGGPFSINSLSFALTNAGTNSLSWTLVNTSLWLNVSATNGTLTAHGPAATVTVGLNTAASNLVVGAYSGTLWFTNQNDHVGQDRLFTLNVISPPTVTTQPTNQAVLDGATAAFSVQVTGGLPLSFQWQQNGTNLTDGGNISGSATTNLTISNASAVNVGTYAIIVTNFAGMTTSSNASLTIIPSSPVIVALSTNPVVYVGANVPLAVAAVGSKPFAYQWSFNTTNLVGATNATLTLTNAQINQSGNYSVTITNAYGSTNSPAVLVTINPLPPCAPVSSGMVGWWAAEGNAIDSIGTNNGTLMGTAGFTNGEVGQAFSFDGSSGYVSIPDSPLMDSFTNRISIELWLKAGQLTANADWKGIVTKGNSSWRLQATTFANTLTFSTTGVSPSGDLFGTRNVNDGQWHHVAAVYDGANMFLYVDGTLDVSQPATGSIVQNSYPVYLGGNANPPSGHSYLFNGLVDEVSIYNRALTASEIQLIYITGIGGKCPVPVTISSEPTNQTVTAGTPATFTVSATGSQPLSYQWNFNGTNLAGATNRVFTLANVQPTNGGIYSVVVSNLFGPVTSSNAVLTVLTQPPVIVTPPAGQTNYVGTTASFSVVASGSPPLSYQWSCNTTNIVGATNATLTLTNLQLNQSGNYSVGITNAYGSTNSGAVILTVNPLPPCDPPPSGLVAWWQAEGNANDSIGMNNGTLMGTAGFAAGEVGQAFSFDGANGYVSIPDSPVMDSFTNSITIELWLKSGQLTANSDWAGIITKGNTSWRLMGTTFAKTVDWGLSGVTPLELTSTRSVNDEQWHHVAAVYDGANMSLYVDGTLDVSQPATGSIVQNSYPVYLGGNANPPTGHSYLFNGLVDEVSLYHRALTATEIQAIYITGRGGKCTSPVPPTIVAQPAGQTNYVGTTASLTVLASGSLPLSYQWSFNTTNIMGATNATLTLTNVQLNQAGNYSVGIANAYGSTNSAVVVLVVNPLPSCDPPPSGMVAWWAAEGNAGDSIGTNNGTLMGSAGFAAGKVGQAFSFDGSSGYVSIPDSPLMDSFTNRMSIELWMKSGKLTANTDWASFVSKGNSSWRLMGTTFAKTVDWDLTGVTPLELTGTKNVNDGQWHHVAGVYDGTNMYLYVDGTLDVSHPATGSIVQNSYPVCLGQNAEAPNYLFNGLVDEVSIYNRALTAAEIQAIYATGSGGQCPVQIGIINGPTNQTVKAGGTATFTVAASSAEPLSYQWQKNGTNLVAGGNISGATNSTLTIANVSDADTAPYRAVVSDPYTSVTTSNALLTVLDVRAARAVAIVTNGFVVGVTVTYNGGGYTNAPVVRFIGGGGSGAQAVAVVSNGVVVAVTILNAGSGYTNTPLVVIDPPFILNPVLDIAPMSFLTFSNLSLGGTYQLQRSWAWYWTNQPVSFTASNSVYTQMVGGVVGVGDYRLALNPVPAQAFATPQVVNGFVVGINVISGGSGYPGSPAVSIVGGGGANASAASHVSGGVVTSISIVSPGSGYTNTPSVQIAPPPAAAVAPTVQPVMRVDSASLAPYASYQIQVVPALGVTWGNWSGGLFNPTDVTNSQYLFITNGTSFFRLQYVP